LLQTLNGIAQLQAKRIKATKESKIERKEIGNRSLEKQKGLQNYAREPEIGLFISTSGDHN